MRGAQCVGLSQLNSWYFTRIHVDEMHQATVRIIPIIPVSWMGWIRTDGCTRAKPLLWGQQIQMYTNLYRSLFDKRFRSTWLRRQRCWISDKPMRSSCRGDSNDSSYSLQKCCCYCNWQVRCIVAAQRTVQRVSSFAQYLLHMQMKTFSTLEIEVTIAL